MKGLFSFDPSSSSVSLSRSNEKKRPPNIRLSLFRKFFPKYLKDLSFLTKGDPIISKLKRTKVIRDFTASSSADHRRPEWRLIIANKAKSVKILSGYPEFTNQFAEKIKLLSYLTSLHIFLPFTPHSSANNNVHLLKACNQMKRLSHLKNLEFIQLTKFSKALLQELNASPRLLKSLKNLILSCQWRGGQDTDMMEILKNSKNLLKYVTSLKLGMLSSPSHYANFQALAGGCPSLSCLSFEFCCPESFDQQLSAEINFLDAVKTFQNLRSLNLLIGDIFIFLRDFTLPPLVESLILNFEQCLSMEILCRINHIFTDHMEGTPTLERFYENFHRLHSLQVLKIFFRSDVSQEGYKYQNYLSQGILKRISSLKKLTFMGSPARFSRKKDALPFLNDTYLPQFLQSLSHLHQTLEIGSERSIISGFDLSSLRNKFIKLSAITITGILDHSDINILLFLEQIISLGDSLTTIKLNISVDCTRKSLLSLLQQLYKLSRPKSLRLKLQTKFFENRNLEALRSDFKDFMKESLEERPKLHGIALKLNVDENILKYLRGFLGIYSKKFDNFIIIPNSCGFSYK